MYSSSPYVVIGYGNELHGETACRHAAHLVGELDLPGVRVVSTHQLCPEIAAEIANATIVVFIGPFPAGADGSCRLVRLTERAVNTSKGGDLSPADLLFHVREVYGRSPEAWLVGLPTEGFSIESELSPVAQSAACEAAEYVRDMLWVRQVTQMRQTRSLVLEENRGWA